VKGAAGIDQHHVAVLQHLRILDPVRIGGRLAEQHDAEIGAGSTDTAVRLVDEGLDLRRGDAFVQHTGRGPLHRQRHVLGTLHQRNFLWRLAHAAVCGHLATVDQLVTVCTLTDAVGDEEGRAFVDADARRLFRVGRNTQLCQRRHKQRIRALVFVPGIHLALQLHVVVQRADLEPGGDELQRTVGRQDRPHHALAGVPFQAGKVVEAGTGVQVQRGDVVGLHVRLRLGQPDAILVQPYRLRTLRHVLQASQRLLLAHPTHAYRHHLLPLRFFTAGLQPAHTKAVIYDCTTTGSSVF